MEQMHSIKNVCHIQLLNLNFQLLANSQEKQKPSKMLISVCVTRWSSG